MAGNCAAAKSPDPLRSHPEDEATFLRRIRGDLAESECTFWACPGPDAPDTPMATCPKCQVVHEIDGRLAAAQRRADWPGPTGEGDGSDRGAGG